MAATGMFADRADAASVLGADPDLARHIPTGDRAQAGVATRARVVHVERGAWPPSGIASGGLGLLVLEGALSRVVRVGRRESLELLGPGDLLSRGDDELASTFDSDVVWEAVEDSTVAVLDARFCRAVRPWPQLTAALAARGLRRGRWLAAQAAINAHPTVEERLMLTFCHLAERMGRVGPGGVTVALPLSHRQLAQLVCALRPSVTAGLLRLREDGRLVNPSRGRWVITREGLDYTRELCRQPVIEC